MILGNREQRRAFGLGEFAQMFGISKDSAKRAAATGALLTILLGGRRLVPLAEVHRVEKEGLPGAKRKRRDCLRQELAREAR